ncbi:MAG TPA: glycosyltransferase family 87 protein [Chloroflexota bacterium]|nr:glycosyltransferase family 87 protein [Chloroflexota bacterium]
MSIDRARARSTTHFSSWTSGVLRRQARLVAGIFVVALLARQVEGFSTRIGTMERTASMFLPGLAVTPFLAAVGWVMLNVVVAAGSIAILARTVATPGAIGLGLTRPAPSYAAVVLVSIALTVACAPLMSALLSGQAAGVTLALFVLAFLSLTQGREDLGGVSLALLAVVEPRILLGPFLFIIVQRRVRAVLAFFVGIASFICLGVWTVGLVGVAAYGGLLVRTRGFIGDPTMEGVSWPVAGGMPWIGRLPLVDAAAAAALAAAIGAGALLTVAYRWRRRAPSGRAFVRAYVGFTAAGLLAFPGLVYQDVAILLPCSVAALWLDRAALATLVHEVRLAARSARRRARGGRFAPISRWRWPGVAVASAAVVFGAPSIAWLAIGPAALDAPVWGTVGAIALLAWVIATLPAGGRAEIPRPLRGTGQHEGAIGLPAPSTDH